MGYHAKPGDWGRVTSTMDITWFGQACFKLRGKQATVVTDPFDPKFTGIKLPTTSADIVTVSHTHQDHNFAKGIEGTPFVVKGPGEYEVKGVYVVGVQTFHDREQGAQRGQNVAYAITIDTITVAHLGDLGHKLGNDQLEALGNIDVLLVPVGGTYTIDAEKAIEVVAQIEPKVVIPMHYKIPGIPFDLAPVDAFLKEFGREDIHPVPRLSITKEKLPAETHIVVLEKQ